MTRPTPGIILIVTLFCVLVNVAVAADTVAITARQTVVRAGTTTRWGFGDDASQLGRYAWHERNAGNQTHPVGQLPPNPWGLYDMYGNVREWVQDWYGSYTSGIAVDPVGPSSGSARVNRGGSWHDTARYCGSANRGYDAPDYHDSCLGFRLLRVAP